jgi:hypothetical protein
VFEDVAGHELPFGPQQCAFAGRLLFRSVAHAPSAGAGPVTGEAVLGRDRGRH